MNIIVLIVLGLTALNQAYSLPSSSGDKADTDHIQHIPNNSRKQFNNYKRFEVMKRTDDDDEKNNGKEREVPYNVGTNSMDVNSIVLAIDTGAKPEVHDRKGKMDAIDKIVQTVKDLVKPVNLNPLMRARNDYNIKPEVIQFRSGQPSLKFDINSESIIRAVQSLLTSKAVRRYTDEIAQTAAVVFKVIKEDIRKHDKGY